MYQECSTNRGVAELFVGVGGTVEMYCDLSNIQALLQPHVPIQFTVKRAF